MVCPQLNYTESATSRNPRAIKPGVTWAAPQWTRRGKHSGRSRQGARGPMHVGGTGYRVQVQERGHRNVGGGLECLASAHACAGAAAITATRSRAGGGMVQVQVHGARCV